MKQILVLLLGVCVLLVACNSNQQTYNDLDSFTNYLEKNSSSFSDKDWDNDILEYSAIVEKIDSHTYTDEELVAIGRLKGKCAAQFAKRSIRNTKNELNNFLKESEGFIQSFVEEFSKEDVD